MTQLARAVRYRAGVPVYRYQTTPEIPPVSVMRIDTVYKPGHGQRHIHEFPVLAYVEQVRDLAGPIRSGDAVVLAPGEVVDSSVTRSIAAGAGLFFDPAALGGDFQAPWSSWRSHPLLFPFLHGLPGGLLRLEVPEARQPMWTATIAAIETELADRNQGYQQAALAHLTLLLVDVARLATDVVGDLRRSNETLLAEVFETIERRYAEPLSLSAVAESVGMTPGHLTTVVRRRTGRTVGDWITERRMAQARRLLTDTDLPVNDIARRVGLPDPGYFARVFRRSNGVPPREWRQLFRSSSGIPASGLGSAPWEPVNRRVVLQPAQQPTHVGEGAQ